MFGSKFAAVPLILLVSGSLSLQGAQPSTDGTTAPPAQPAAESYAWRNVVIGGGGFVTGIIFHPAQKGLVYARTDVGGAYRWDSSLARWIPITDWVGADNGNWTGIESLAVDPSDPNRVYLAAGTYSSEPAAILRSDDQGKTFEHTAVPFTMGGNESGRFNGERLAVDPNDGQILLFGSRQDGLWKSPDRGATWSRVGTFPAIDSSPEVVTNRANSRRAFGWSQRPIGIVSIVFNPASGRRGQPTPEIYAAVSTAGTNLFRSADAGARWEAVPGQPIGLRPNHVVLSPDGALYLTYGKEPGPNSMTDGAVWKFSPGTGSWTDITPIKPAGSGQPFGYGAVSVDAQHPSTIMTSTFDHWKPHDLIFRSTNGGTNWIQVWQEETEWDHSIAPYTESRTPHWIGDLKINPFDSDQVLFTTGFGIWSSVNATRADSGRSTRWIFFDAGLEETVPLALISPPEGAHLLSGLGDIDGFRHDDLTVSPPQGTFEGPHFGNTEDLAFAAGKPALMVRSGTARGQSQRRAAYSMDGGKSWTAFATEPANSAGAGTVGMACDGSRIVWTPRRSAPHYTVDNGRHWFACEGLSAGVRVVADPEDASRFYAFDARQRQLLASTNGAEAFSPTPASFPQEERLGEGGGDGGQGELLCATPGRSGDLWLAFRDRGLFHSSDAGASFTKIQGIQRAISLGFGKAAPGQAAPALYLQGKIQGCTALYRSHDFAQSWVRINDDQHQFGWISHVTGDPRVFGRVYFATGGRGVIYGDPAPRPVAQSASR